MISVYSPGTKGFVAFESSDTEAIECVIEETILQLDNCLMYKVYFWKGGELKTVIVYPSQFKTDISKVPIGFKQN